MINQIAAFYVGESPADAPANIAAHLKRFWEPRMRGAIADHNRNGGAGMHEAARQAVSMLVKG
jgi:formate dehydrogenase subunit delta